MKLKVKSWNILRYGQDLKAWVILSPGQIWDVYHVPSEQKPFYGIKREGTILEVEEENIIRLFKEVVEDD